MTANGTLRFHTAKHGRKENICIDLRESQPTPPRSRYPRRPPLSILRSVHGAITAPMMVLPRLTMDRALATLAESSCGFRAGLKRCAEARGRCEEKCSNH